MDLVRITRVIAAPVVADLRIMLFEGDELWGFGFVCLFCFGFFYGIWPLHLMNFTMDALMRYGQEILGNCLLAYELVFSMSIARRSSCHGNLGFILHSL